jgi:hypothetical protein
LAGVAGVAGAAGAAWASTAPANSALISAAMILFMFSP